MKRLLAPLLALLLFTAPALAQQSSPAPVPSGPQSHPIEAGDAFTKLKSRLTVLIDTREDYEKEAGVPEGVDLASVYPMNGSRDAQFIADVLKAAGGRKDADITLICTTGIRSAAAERLLAANGFTNAHTIVGGFTGWSAAGLPKSMPKK